MRRCREQSKKDLYRCTAEVLAKIPGFYANEGAQKGAEQMSNN
jgi:hypothetical protein